MAAPGPVGPTWLGLAIAAFVLGSVARIFAARGDLWLDEIGAFTWVRMMRSPLDALLRIHNDNSHVLNTIWAYYWGPHRSALLYRFPAIAAGCVAIVLAGSVNVAQSARPSADLRSRRRAFAIGAAVFACSFLMIQYASEARGYALTIALAMMALFAALRGEDWGVSRWTVIYWLSVGLALVAHALAVHVLLGAAVWQAGEVAVRREPRFLVRMSRWLTWQMPPFAFLVWLYLVHLRPMEIAGGGRLDLLTVASSAAAHTFGVPPLRILGMLSLLAVGVGGIAALVVWPPKGGAEPRSLWLFYLVGGFLSPWALQAATQPLAYERYFTVSLALLLLLWSATLTRLAERGHRAELVVAALLILASFGNAIPTASLLRLGRGHYREALAGMVARSSDEVVTIGGDQDFRIQTIVDYYATEVSGPDHLVLYVPRAQWSSTTPAWFIWGWQSQDAVPPESLRFDEGASFEASAAFPTSALSGFNWRVYSRRP